MITSLHNPAVQSARDLERRKTARDAEGLYVAWGVHLAQEAITAHAPIVTAFTGPQLEASTEGRAVLAHLRRGSQRLIRASTRVLDGIAAGAGDQGVLLVVRRPAHDLGRLMEAGPDLLLAAHGVQDPGNLGSLMRSALAFGARGLVVLEGCADPFGSRAVRAAMGAQFSLAAVGAAAGEALAAWRAAAMQIVAADPRGDCLPPQADLARPTVILVGGEGAGLPPTLLGDADRRVRIPMTAPVVSLNVHAAAVTLLYETSRQRGFR